MRRILLNSLWISAALCGAALAQGYQNSDISYLGGSAVPVSQTVPGTSVTVSGSTGFSYQFNIGHQLLRLGAGDLWFEFPQTFCIRSDRLSSTGSSTRQTMFMLTPGIRFQRFLSERTSIYGAAGFGYGSFEYYQPSPTSTSGVTTWPTSHGVFDVGAGIDFHLSPRLSLRGEVRDFITGKGLSGATGRQHLIYLFGLAFHF